MIIFIFLSSMVVRTYPITIVIYILGSLLAVILSVFISNAYETSLLNSEILGTTYASMTELNFFMLYLPIEIAVIGLLGGLFVGLINIARPSEDTGGFG